MIRTIFAYCFALSFLLAGCQSEKAASFSESGKSGAEQVVDTESFKAMKTSMDDSVELKLYPALDQSMAYNLESTEPLEMVGRLGKSRIKEIRKDQGFSVIPYVFLPCSKIANGSASATIDFQILDSKEKPLIEAKATQIKVIKDSLKDTYGVCTFIANNFLVTRFAQSVPVGEYEIRSSIKIDSDNYTESTKIKLKLID